MGLTGEYGYLCSTCGLHIEGLTSAEQAKKAGQVHQEFVHRLGLYIETPPEDEPEST